jgi:creatinine amidohydrolase/Fe(II)-dependent formamide hydrolase-like protein
MANPEIGKKIVNASVEGFLEEIERLNSTLL